MDWKVASAFSAGTVLACGIVYFAMKPAGERATAPQVVLVKPAIVARTAPPPVLPAPPRALPAATPAKPIATEKPVRVFRPVREKPSPMPPPVRQPKIVELGPIQAKQAGPGPGVPQTAEAAPPPQPVAPPPAAAPAPVPPPVQLKNVVAPRPQPILAPRVPLTVTLHAGTLLAVRIGQTISTDRNRPGDVFLATLARPLVIDGYIVADRGERVAGEVMRSVAPRFRSDPSELAVALVRLATDDRQNIAIRTQPYATHAVNMSRFGHARAEIPVETYLTFRVADSIRITERVN